MKESRKAFPAAILFALCVTNAAASDWTRFRGPNGAGISDSKGIPAKFTEADYNWKVSLPGLGHSQPVIWDDKIFVTSAARDGSWRALICLHTGDGDTSWTTRYELRDYGIHERNSFASSTPAVDANRVYAGMVDGTELFVVALDHSGKKVWRRSLGAFHSRHGFGASPIVFEDMLIVPKEQVRAEDGPEMVNRVYALDLESGETKWSTPRRSRKTAYGTPCVYEETEGRPELLFTSGATGIYSIEARSGKPLWDADVFDKRTVSSPVVTAGLVFGTCGSGGGGNYLVAVRPGGRGDVKDTHQRYLLRQSIPYVPTPLGKGNRLYLWGDKGIVTCLEASTGRTIWQERVNGSYSGSPVWVDGRLFCVSNQGVVVVVAADDEFEVLARNPLGAPSRSTPAISGGRMYLRTISHLISVGGKKVAAR